MSTCHLKCFQRASHAVSGSLEEVLPVSAQAICTRCQCAQTKRAKPSQPNWSRTSPAGSHTRNKMDGKEMPRSQKPNGTTTERLIWTDLKGKYIFELWRQADPKDAKRREALGSILVPLFVCFFLLPLGLPYVNWASQVCCLLYLRSSLQSLDLPLFYFHWLFPSLSFSHRHSGLLFPIPITYQM